MTTTYYGLAALSGLTVLLLMLGVISLIRSRSDLGKRLQVYTEQETMPFDAQDERRSLSDRLNEYISERSFADRIRIDLARAGVKLAVPEYVLIKLAAALIPLTILFLFKQLLAGVLLAGLCFFIPDIWLRRRQRRRWADFGQQLPETLDLIVGGLKAGFSLQHSLSNVSKQAAEPTATEFQRLGQEMQLGLPLMAALDNLLRRIKSDDLDIIVSVFKIHNRVGGNLASILETVGDTIRERVKLRREVRVITSAQRLSGYVLGGLPIALAIILSLLNPSYMGEIFRWDIWLCIPIFAFIMMVIGFLIIRKLVDIQV